jgi:hypothetical protein
MKSTILNVPVVRYRGRYEVRLGGRVIRIRTRTGWMLARFETRLAAEGYRRALLGNPSLTPR